MSRASTAFDGAIEDATALLQQFDVVHKDNQNTGEVLKRAGLVMALTAWETYGKRSGKSPLTRACGGTLRSGRWSAGNSGRPQY